MTENCPKKIPYGVSDFEKMRKGNYYYVDKTRFINEIEKSPDYLFFIRPRRFGKSLWLNTMECYYDIAQKDHFEEIFKGTYIYNNPTKERNSYLILKFNFSEICPDVDKAEESFNQIIKQKIYIFLDKYADILGKLNEELLKEMSSIKTASGILSRLLSLVGSRSKLYILIDEYDNFTNTILSTQGKERYTAITHGEGFFRHFFNVIKAGTTDIGAPIAKLFITGVSPVTMDDVTSGFNIGSNVTIEPAFNEMIGFREEEVREMLSYYIKEGLINDTTDNLIEIMRGWYDNYLFSQKSSVRMYNSDMVLYFIEKYISRGELPQDMVDQNVKIDYGKLRYLILTDLEGSRKVNGNFEKLKTILEEKEISSDIVPGFSVKRIIETENFISLLYYLGLLTIKSEYRGKMLLTIPNEVIRKLFYEYIKECYRDTEIFKIDLYKLGGLFTDFAYEGKWEGLLDYLSSEMKSQTAVRDYIEGEKSIQTFLRVYLSLSNYYLTRTEAELNLGYSDILMLPNIPSYPDMKYSYIFEIKYVKSGRGKKKKEEIEEKIKEAKEGLMKYSDDKLLPRQIGATTLIKVILVFCGAELKHSEAI